MYRFVVLAFCGLVLSAGAVSARAANIPAAPDTRILIDISGSMKKNDPKNLRRPALRLLVGLLPGDSRAGVWTFGQYVNMQVGLGKVGEQWRGTARKGAAKIHSRGLFTNIEEAIKQATADWSEPTQAYQRHLVLLTDGMVDVSKDAAKSEQSRARILQQQLPRLQSLGVKIHTVALSARADHALLKALSRSSDGWYEQVASAGELQKVFLRIFEKVGNPDTVPLKDNRFKVDDSIREVTLIVFRPEDAAPTKVTRPNGEVFDEQALPSNVSWHKDEGYDLLTVRDPMPGEWMIQAQLDPDNRVMILTDLRMQVSETVNQVVAGQRIPMHVTFLEQGKVVARREFVDVMHLSAEQTGPDGLRTEPRPLRDDGQGDDPLAYDGRFEWRFEPKGAWGRAELVILAEGTTFQREKRRIFELALPADAALVPSEADQTMILSVRADPAVITPDSMEATAELALADGSHQGVPLTRQADGAYQGVVDPALIAGTAELAIRIRARTLGGDLVGTELPFMQVRGKLEPIQPPVTVEGQTQTPEQAPEESAQDTDPNVLMIGFAVLNGTLLVIGGLVFWLLRRRKKKDPFTLVDDEDDEQETATDDASGGADTDIEEKAA